RVAGRAHVRGAVVAEVAHMLAELVENALVFSPPDARVEVVSRAAEGECRVTIADYGAGRAAGELAAANARLRGEQRFLAGPASVPRPRPGCGPGRREAWRRRPAGEKAWWVGSPGCWQCGCRCTPRPAQASPRWWCSRTSSWTRGPRSSPRTPADGQRPLKA